ncbi:MAG TPA: hypothetical protein VHD36_02425 [Pirellulales bacterium]|nr:hypothetical protein [Pirellulales bacterium]
MLLCAGAPAAGVNTGADTPADDGRGKGSIGERPPSTWGRRTTGNEEGFVGGAVAVGNASTAETRA